MITADELRRLLAYDPDTGVFVWMVRPARRVTVGAVAGCTDAKGYRSIQIDGTQYYAHRLAWLHVHGVLPVADIDHINGDRSDNRMCNLRAATRVENSANRGANRNNTSGHKGVSWHKRDLKWRAKIAVGGIHRHLGYFDTAKEAHAAYCEAAKNIHGEFAISGGD